MIEVFKTNVTDQQHAAALIAQLHVVFTNIRATFDLEDCDRVLRVTCSTQAICPYKITELLQQHGYCASLLTDDCCSEHSLNSSVVVTTKNYQTITNKNKTV